MSSVEASAPPNSFAKKRSLLDLGLDPCLADAVKNAFQVELASEIQAKVIPRLCSPEASSADVLIRSRTGSGKTLAFVLPILHRLLEERRSSPAADQPGSSLRSLGTLAVVVVPTRELAAQTQTVLESLLAKLKGKDHWLVSCTLSGGDRKKSEKERLRKGVHIVVGTPGRLLDHLQSTEKWTRQLQAVCRWVVLDEADRLLDAGFEKSVKEILDRISSRGQRPQLLLCSATVEASTQEIFGFRLADPMLIAESESGETKTKEKNKDKDKTKDKTKETETKTRMQKKDHARPDDSNALEPPNPQLEHFYLCTPTKLRLAALLGLLEETTLSSQGPQKIVLFTICCDTVDYLHALFCAPSFKLLPAPLKVFKLHGNLEHKTRLETFAAFTKETGHCVLVCTDIAARGLNLSHVSCIVQFDAPCDIKDYIHRAGRTARQEERGKSIIFLMPSERDYVHELEKHSLTIRSLRWAPLVERIAGKVRLPSAEDASSSPVEAMVEEGGEQLVRETSLDTRKRMQHWLGQLQAAVRAKEELFGMAKNAFLSFVRAYATHPSTEKAIFHIKQLHLGHLAETFLLAEAPKAVAARQNALAAAQHRADRSKEKRGPGPTPRAPLKPKRIVSEFDAGDATASFMQPRKAKHVRK